MRSSLIVVPALVLALGACGGGDSPEASPTTPAPTSSAPSPSESEPPSSEPSPSESESEEPEATEAGVFDLEVGDCLVEADIDDVETVPLVDCSASHLYEIYAAFDLDDGPFPGDDAVNDEAQEQCLAQFDAFIGFPYAESIWDFTSLLPTEDTWNELDDREVLCLAVPVDEQSTTGSARGVGE